ncbi:MAG: hypothetical protein HY817_05990 [Candidatus Abawacabacteria bacterium]|nr:hypothetical protein [Candidatus Abawacabacteria bacterium]
MNKRIPFLARILSGQKTIESRWYQMKRAPWDKACSGDTIYFKNVGELVSTRATVKAVKQFADLTQSERERLVLDNASKLGIEPVEVKVFLEHIANKRYVIFLYLSKIESVKPFGINKKGFGAMSAWITLTDIQALSATENTLS